MHPFFKRIFGQANIIIRHFFFKPSVNPLCKSMHPLGTLHFKMKILLANSSKKSEGVLVIFKHYWFNPDHQNYSRSIFSFLIKIFIEEIYWNWIFNPLQPLCDNYCSSVVYWACSSHFLLLMFVLICEFVSCSLVSFLSFLLYCSYSGCKGLKI